MERLRSKNAARHRLRLLRQIIERDGPYCFWCGEETLISARRHLHIKNSAGGNSAMRERAPTFDHIVPVVDGGEDSADNGVCACYRCNRERGRTDASVYLFTLIRMAPAEVGCKPLVDMVTSAGAVVAHPEEVS